jgi:hypothetical protein
MNKRGRNILSILDNAVRWTGFPARVAADMSETSTVDRKHRPLRWSPIWPIAFSCILFGLSFMWPSVLLSSLGAVIAGMASSIHINGPLGKPSLEDDEREAALRKDSFLFCLGLLVFLNCAGQLLFLGLSILQNWQTAQRVSVAASALMLNLTLLGCLPTLYASWKMRQLPEE